MDRLHDLVDLVLRQGDRDVPVPVHSLGDLEPETSWHKRLRQLDQYIVYVVPFLATDLEDVTKSTCRDQSSASALAFDHGIRRQGGPMDHGRERRGVDLPPRQEP